MLVRLWRKQRTTNNACPPEFTRLWRGGNKELRSINNERLCKTNPIPERPKNVQMVITLVKTRNYNNEQRTMNYELLFETNPIKPNFIRLRRTCPPPAGLPQKPVLQKIYIVISSLFCNISSFTGGF